MLIGKLFAFGGATGLALAVARRARAIFWSVVGAVCLVFLSRTPRRQPVPNSEQPPDRTGAAVILADGLFGYCGPRALPRCGRNPRPAARDSGATEGRIRRIVVVVDPLTGRSAERALRRTRRLPDGRMV